jgi:lysozyme family protein
MASFEIADKLTSINEGGYANDGSDRGGETWKGIARKMHPQWEGWSFVDWYKKHPGFPSVLNKSDRLEELRKSFYKINFWDQIKGDELLFQEIANQIYDDAVNTSPVPAIRKAQNAAFGLSEDLKEKDYMIKNIGITYGKMDTVTLNKLNLVK